MRLILAGAFLRRLLLFLPLLWPPPRCPPPPTSSSCGWVGAGCQGPPGAPGVARSSPSLIGQDRQHTMFLTTLCWRAPWCRLLLLCPTHCLPLSSAKLTPVCSLSVITCLSFFLFYDVFNLVASTILVDVIPLIFIYTPPASPLQPSQFSQCPCIP